MHYSVSRFDDFACRLPLIAFALVGDLLMQFGYLDASLSPVLGTFDFAVHPSLSDTKLPSGLFVGRKPGIFKKGAIREGGEFIDANINPNGRLNIKIKRWQLFY